MNLKHNEVQSYCDMWLDSHTCCRFHYECSKINQCDTMSIKSKSSYNSYYHKHGIYKDEICLELYKSERYVLGILD